MDKCNAEHKGINFIIELNGQGAGKERLKLTLTADGCQEQFQQFAEIHSLSLEECTSIREAIEQAVSNMHQRSLDYRVSSHKVLADLEGRDSDHSEKARKHVRDEPKVIDRHESPRGSTRKLRHQKEPSDALNESEQESRVVVPCATPIKFEKSPQKSRHAVEMPVYDRPPGRCVLLKDHQFELGNNTHTTSKTPIKTPNKISKQATEQPSTTKLSTEASHSNKNIKRKALHIPKSRQACKQAAPEQVWNVPESRKIRSPSPHLYQPHNSIDIDKCTAHKCGAWQRKNIREESPKQEGEPRAADDFYDVKKLSEQGCQRHQCLVWKFNTNSGGRKPPVVTMQYSPVKKPWSGTLRAPAEPPQKKQPPLSKYLPNPEIKSFYTNFEMMCAQLNY